MALGVQFAIEARLSATAFISFYPYCEHEQVLESLHLWLSGQRYARAPSSLRPLLGRDMIQRFFDDNAPERVNVTAPVREAVLGGSEGAAGRFEQAVGVVGQLLGSERWPEHKERWLNLQPPPPTPATPKEVRKLILTLPEEWRDVYELLLLDTPLPSPTPPVEPLAQKHLRFQLTLRPDSFPRIIAATFKEELEWSTLLLAVPVLAALGGERLADLARLISTPKPSQPPQPTPSIAPLVLWRAAVQVLGAGWLEELLSERVRLLHLGGAGKEGGKETPLDVESAAATAAALLSDLSSLPPPLPLVRVLRAMDEPLRVRALLDSLARGLADPNSWLPPDLRLYEGPPPPSLPPSLTRIRSKGSSCLPSCGGPPAQCGPGLRRLPLGVCLA